MRPGSSLRTAALALASVVLFAVQQRLLDAATFARRGVVRHALGGPPLGPSDYLTLPFPVLDSGFSPPTRIHLILLVIGAVQALVLFGLYRTLRGRAWTPLEHALLAVAAVALLAEGMTAKTLIGFDLYAYTGYAKLPTVAAAYAPPAIRFPAPFGIINDEWGFPMIPSYYGPLWIAVSRGLVGGATGIAGAITTLRAFALVTFVALGAALLLRRGALVAVLFVLDPAAVQLFVANGHNDLLGIVLVVLAFGCAERVPLAAVVLVALGGLVKLPFAASALLVFAGRDGLPRRLAWVALTGVLVVGASLLLAGPSYARDLVSRLHEVNAIGFQANQLTGHALKTVLTALALLALLAAFVRGVLWRNAGWSLSALSSMIYPWYLSGAIPYAQLDERALVRYLVLFPFAAALLENAFPHLGTGQLAMLAMIAAAAYEIVRRRTVRIEG